MQTIQIFTLGASNGRGLFFPSGLNASKALNGTSKDIGLSVPPFTVNVSLKPSWRCVKVVLHLHDLLLATGAVLRLLFLNLEFLNLHECPIGKAHLRRGGQ